MEPRDRIEAYFAACTSGSAADIAEHFTHDATIYDTNIRPITGNDTIGAMWVTVRERWGGAAWYVDTCVTDRDTAAIEWHMTGTEPVDQRSFVFRGSEHYTFHDTLIAEIRQYWTFDPDKLDTALIGYEHEGH